MRKQYWRSQAGQWLGKLANGLVGCCLSCTILVFIYIAVSTGSTTIADCPVLPSDNIWNTPIDNLPLDANSALYVQTIGSNAYMHADFGSGSWENGSIGIPYNIVPGTQAKTAVTFQWPDQSDPGPYPIPDNPQIEHNPDHHMLIIDKDNCMLYELFFVSYSGSSWSAGAGAIFNLRSNELRPAGWTSADAAGLPIFPGLARYEEVAAGEITHALRFTAPQTRNAYVWPARHQVSWFSGTQYPPMGQRFRLRADYDISGFSWQAQVILRALKRYGMILADHGEAWYIIGSPDEGWDNDQLHELNQLRGSDFEAVDESSLQQYQNSGLAVHYSAFIFLPFILLQGV